MITKKELSFVNGWAKKVPYPGIKYAENTAKKLIDAFHDYEESYYNKEYDIVLSNGEQILFEILNKNLCHMLGVDYKNLSSEYLENIRREVLMLPGDVNSYGMLTSIINNIDKVLEYDYNNDGRILNYYRVMIKCSIFEKLSDFSEFNFGVINFDKDNYKNKTGRNINTKSDKYLYVQSNEAAAPFFMMGILPSEVKEEEQNGEQNEIKYAVETLMAPDDVKGFFNNQEIVLPTQILVTTEDTMNKYEASSKDKIALLNQYKSIINEYNLPNRLNIYGDYEAILAAETNNKKRQK